MPIHFTKKTTLALGGFLVLIFSGAFASAFITAPAISTWYATLTKPGFNPPDGLFGPVWTCLYFLMALSAWLVWQQPSSKSRSRAMAIFWVQLVLNFSWSFIFFGTQRIDLALVDIFLLWASIIAMIVFFRRENSLAGWMQVPYLCWVTFAAILNFEIWRLN